LGIPARAAASAAEAVRDADLIVTATYAKDPLFDAADVRPGAHVNAIGSNQPTRREIPGELLQRAGRIAVDSIEQCQVEAGDLILGLHDWRRVDELQGFAQWPERDPEAITVFKSVGLGVEDVAAAGWVYERARESGRGQVLPLFA
jgi:ornithine cyclodeaminase/alanine dehydrogenase-like protein (mu-crystallin family)